MDGRSRALIVEDDDPIRSLLSTLIERLEFDVEAARDGGEAIERLNGNGDKYDVILLDLMMPRVNGFDVLQHMREHHPEQLERTIVASAVPRAEIMNRLDEPVFRIHSKPFDMAKLMTDIRDCAAGQ